MRNLILVILAGLCLAGCKGAAMIPADQFKAELEDAMVTMRYADYIGQHDGNACLRQHRKKLVGQGWKTRVMCTPVQDLDPVYLADLEVELRRDRLSP
ncbi:MAG: hypothetical protein KC897_06650 [Candidatus Omnitrophica bacterium]|nr:hypothetical protein [Candidatus Omnitrophota bacterium]MCB9722294.1 hypothetical protein [Candidatus Omnitrophota bacterium]